MPSPAEFAFLVFAAGWVGILFAMGLRSWDRYRRAPVANRRDRADALISFGVGLLLAAALLVSVATGAK